MFFLMGVFKEIYKISLSKRKAEIGNEMQRINNGCFCLGI